MRVDSSLDLSIENEKSQLLFESTKRRVKSSRHLPQIGRLIGAKVLSQSSMTNPHVERINMRREIHVEEQMVLHLIHEFQTNRVFRLVEFE